MDRVLLWQAQLANWIKRKLSRGDEVGASLVEYVLLLTLIAVAAIGALVALSHTITNTLNNVSTSITTHP